jgi:ubiquinone/menaquinone biosynthesis C-methylase UbiE
MRMFGRPTGRLGRLGGLILARTNRKAAASAIELLAVRPGDRVLEIGFGPGVGIEMMAQRAPPVTVAGVDPSAEMLSQATARNAWAVRDCRVELHLASADRLPFGDDVFDKGVDVNSLQGAPDAAAGMREVRRVMKPGGKVVLAFTPYAGQSNDAVSVAIAAADFAPPRIVARENLYCVIARKP